MSKKLFVLLVVAMVLVAVTTIALTLAGHGDMVSAAFGWIAHSVTSVVETLGAIGVLILVALVL